MAVRLAAGRRPLVPRFEKQGYRHDLVAKRRQWLKNLVGCDLDAVGAFSLDIEQTRGNIENPIGAAQVPLGIAGPLEIDGEHASGTFYVPLATTEGALVRSYERGMLALSRSGGAQTRLLLDENKITPIFTFASLSAAVTFARSLPAKHAELTRLAGATTQHGELIGIDAFPQGRRVLIDFRYRTADAHGMNMIVKATDAACSWLRQTCDCIGYAILSGYSAEKRAAGALLRGGKGKTVIAGGILPRAVVQSVFRVTPEAIVDLGQQTLAGHLRAGAIGYNAHLANGLAAIFIACGQDVANVANSAVGITELDLVESAEKGEGPSLSAHVTLPSLSVATVGGGTALGTARECLSIIDCFGSGKAQKFAEIVAATLLAGELSMAAAIAAHEFVAAHDHYGRNRPTDSDSI